MKADLSSAKLDDDWRLAPHIEPSLAKYNLQRARIDRFRESKTELIVSVIKATNNFAADVRMNQLRSH